MSDRFLRRPNQALQQTLTHNDKTLNSIEAKSYGAGAVREVFESGTIQIARNVDTAIASTTCDPGRWSIIFAALCTLNVPIQTDSSGVVYPENRVVTASATLTNVPSATRFLFQTTSGTLTQQIFGTTIASFDPETPTSIELRFQWSSNFTIANQYSVFNRQITLIPL